MDEFDAVARTRGGRGGKGEQGDAGVARDSVVNQLLAKMDGVQPLPVPTLVIGLTNKRSLIEPGKENFVDSDNLRYAILTVINLITSFQHSCAPDDSRCR
jgi:SpoVK/Ycf46/Vps4 family AAA+-type ATPase